MRARNLMPLVFGVAACGITAIPLPGEEWRHRGPDGAETGRDTGTTSDIDTRTGQNTGTSTSSSSATSTEAQTNASSTATDAGATGAGTSTSGSSSSTATTTATIVDTDTSTAFRAETAWAQWKMPHPAGAKDPFSNALLPNQASYLYSADSVTVRDTVTGLEWQRTPESGTHSWAEAQSICARLVLAGKTDWRLPSRIELISLLDDTATTAPMIDTAAFPSTPSSTYYWSASLVRVSGSDQMAWGLYGTTVTGLALNQRNYVRCVRGGGS